MMNAEETSSSLVLSDFTHAPQVPPPLPSILLPCPRAFALAATLALLFFTPPAPAQTDNFDDGDDPGWTRLNPLAGAGVGGTGQWSFPSGGYRIQASPSLVPNPYGPGRAGSLVTGPSLTKFYVAADVVAWDNSLDQIFGLLARLGNQGLGTTRGYAFTYATRTGRNPTGQLEILKITNEAGADVPGAVLNFTLQPSVAYRLVFSGNGESLTGQVFSRTNLTVPLATVTGDDSTYPSGAVGVFTYDNSPSSMNRADVTFDNFLAAPSAPPPLTISADTLGQLTVSWSTSGESFRLERTPALAPAEWSTIPSFDISEDGINFFHHPDPGAPASFFRLNWP